MLRPKPWKDKESDLAEWRGHRTQKREPRTHAKLSRMEKKPRPSQRSQRQGGTRHNAKQEARSKDTGNQKVVKNETAE